ncbi:interleukin-10 isoform X2 [Hippoglossus hippoglossus]|uniref:interleukin-10 isoform X2 n=1 Tax=Hippoglossus hippoglossus TaxID=8267 RepID=UPI00148C5427|nr:interleukin-10 isoform X2 [Hippoglossus hippoglossus]
MAPWSLLLSLVLLSLLSSAWTSPMCNNHCCRFVEGFPVRLRRLREDYYHIRDFYEANDDLDTALLDQSVEESFNSPFACHAMDSILDFYLSTVLPTAMAGVTEETKDLKPHVESIQQIFDELKEDVTKCVSTRRVRSVKVVITHGLRAVKARCAMSAAHLSQEANTKSLLCS